MRWQKTARRSRAGNLLGGKPGQEGLAINCGCRKRRQIGTLPVICFEVQAAVLWKDHKIAAGGIRGTTLLPSAGIAKDYNNVVQGRHLHSCDHLPSIPVWVRRSFPQMKGSLTRQGLSSLIHSVIYFKACCQSSFSSSLLLTVLHLRVIVTLRCPKSPDWNNYEVRA